MASLSTWVTDINVTITGTGKLSEGTHHEWAVRMLERCVCGEHRVVRLDDGRRQLRGGIHAKFELWFLAIVRGEAFEKKSAEARSSATAKGVENEEALEAIAVVRKPPDLVHGGVDKLLSNSIVTASIYGHTHMRFISENYNMKWDKSAQLFAASSFPVIMLSGWNKARIGPVLTSLITPGSRST
jgi:hypothetical protein